MSGLRLIGYWRSDDEPEWPDPFAFVDESWDTDERQLVVRYTRNAPKLWTQMGISPCRFCGKPNGSSELTDTVYIWPEGLSHYVSDHGVRLPREVVEHMRVGMRAVTREMDTDWWRRVSPDWR